MKSADDVTPARLVAGQRAAVRLKQLSGKRLSRRRLSARSGAVLLIVGVLALAFNLRAAITSLPPIFPELESALHLSAASLSLLAAIPALCFGVFSGTGAPLSRRFGEERVLGAALLLLGTGLLLRGLSPAVLLFPGTIVAAGAIALLNVLLPSLVKRRMPDRAGLVIGLYLLMLSVGAIVGSLLAVPVFTAAGAGTSAGSASLRIALGLWAVTAVLAAVLWLPQLRYRTLPEAPVSGPPAPGKPVRRSGALAMGRYRLAWQVMLFMGLQSLSYYATLSWFPTMFRDRGVSAVQAGELLALMNLGNAVTCLLVPVLAHRARDQRALAVVTSLAIAAGIGGAVFGPAGPGLAGFVVLLGLGQGAALGLGVFFTMARAPDPVTAASLSAFAQGAGYLLASAGPLTVGFLHNATGSWTVPGLALLAVAGVQLVSGWLAGRAQTVPVSVSRTASPLARS
ncbi:MAG TPA: MFS transporter [Streptosporangiaceae bacterium]|nr:MFS transporter [Streptosporangiaceae bacterium]